MDSSQAHFATNRDFRNLVLQGLLVGLVLALLLVLLAPAVDHHFAERQHDHSHVFLTASAASHGHPELHPFEELHLHDGFSDQDSQYNRVLYQTSNDGLGEYGSVFFASFINDGEAYPIDNNDTLSLAMTAGDGVFQETFLVPPTRPPRA